MSSNNIFRRTGSVTIEEKIKVLRQHPLTLWLTGLSASGKSTLAYSLEYELFLLGIKTKVLDGDNLRYGLNEDLDFSLAGRSENIRRVAEVARLFNDEAYVVITSLISPLEEDRNLARDIIGKDRFLLVYVSATLENCQHRDYKGLYEQARLGKIKNFTGISSIYEEPKNPDFLADTNQFTAIQITETLLQTIKKRILYNPT